MFQDCDFAPSEVTDRPNPEGVTEKNQASTHSPYSCPTQSSAIAANLNLDGVALVPLRWPSEQLRWPSGIERLSLEL